MYFKRNFFIFIFLLFSFFLWNFFKKENYLQKKNFSSKENVNSFQNVLHENNNQEVLIKTDVFSIIINKHNGNIKIVDLLKYKETKDSIKNFQLLKKNSNFLYQVKSGFNQINSYNKKISLDYNTKKNFFELLPHHNTLVVPMVCIKEDGTKYKKIFIFKRGRYDIQLKFSVYNFSNKKLNFNVFGEIIQTINSDNSNISNRSHNLNSYRGPAFSSDDQKYKKHDFDKIISNDNLYKKIHSGWIAMLQKYFVTAWVPSKNLGLNTIYTKNINSKIAVIGYYTSSFLVPKYGKKNINSSLWIGPEIQKDMKELSPNLDLTVDYGFLWFLSQPLFKLLNFLHNIIGNWGFSIILITIIVRFFTYPLNRAQYLAMEKLKSLQPKLNYLKNKYNNNKKKMSEKIILLYKKEKINPFSGLLPLIFQMPIFLSLYYMLTNSVELRHSPFIFWIQDLSSYDKFYVLPIIMGITMFFTQKFSSNKKINKNQLNVSSIVSLQEKIVFIIPIFFTLFFLWFPSGLVLYYIVNNMVSIFQHKLVLKNFNKNKKK
ncbi:MAG: membrane protein insertase YidC [Buchnera aphidicola (Periphyllus acericola)]|uniref:membrane protein insertase YidC n=1 Tax=Buchnera aphidicola TaxID=9 RepID=UPI0030D1E99A|nr:membrane protein insertase YidC [Buchnera aphidicola (Periphyllus acericola)]